MIYSGRIVGGVKMLERNGVVLQLPDDASLPRLTRVITWGEPERRLSYAAYLLLEDLFGECYVGEGVSQLHAVLCTLPADQDWSMSRDALLERAFYTRMVHMEIQGRHVALRLVGVPDDPRFSDGLHVLTRTPDGWLEIGSPEREVEERLKSLTPEQLAAGEAYPSLTLFPNQDLLEEFGVWDEQRAQGVRASLQWVAQEHSLDVQQKPDRIMFLCDETPDFRAFLSELKAALQDESDVDQAPEYVVGAPVALADAVSFGQRAREDLVELTLELERIELPRLNHGQLRYTPRQALLAPAWEASRPVLQATLEAIWTAFLESPELRVRQQLAAGWYRVDQHVLQITETRTCTVIPLREFENRPIYKWVDAPQNLVVVVNPEEERPLVC
ncbi:hypothetical protein GCM10008957_32710 [Deinococcus ruber]|uniref:Uncharacterized protein n=1 Tax=Deinococcus ruber TaxID=1848197 RepID=A0A918CDG6_9DEIO|nr:hypothetical protein GCM10008957_32710 [Deinococcus ruber]